MEPYLLQQSLLTTTTTTGRSPRVISSLPPTSSVNNSSTISNVSSIIVRVILISFIGILSIWANHEASKGFSITIVNDASKYSLARKRFSLLYESNDKATRIVLNTSTFVENLLYPNQDLQHFKKQINSVTLRLAPTNFPEFVSVDLSQKPHEYIISLNPSLMEQTSNNNELIVLAVLQGMARVWLWDGKGETPPVLLDGIVEYITTLAGYTMSDRELHHSGGRDIISSEHNEICWKDEDRRKVAGFLRNFDHRIQSTSGGDGEMIRRLNKEMRNGWDDRMVDDVLGMTSQHACASYILMNRHHNPYSSV